jgi:hypothetical protein
MMQDIERNKAFNENHPELTPNGESLDLVAEEMNAVSEEDVAFRRAQGFFRREIDSLGIGDSISYTDIPLQPSIQQFADGLITDSEIRGRVYEYARTILSDEEISAKFKAVVVTV